jgi:hypothetical protein
VPGAGLRPPLKLDVQFSRIQLSGRRTIAGGYGRDRTNEVYKSKLTVEPSCRECLPPHAAPALESVRPDSPHDPSVELVEEPSDVGALEVVPPGYQQVRGQGRVCPLTGEKARSWTGTLRILIVGGLHGRVFTCHVGSSSDSCEGIGRTLAGLERGTDIAAAFLVSFRGACVEAPAATPRARPATPQARRAPPRPVEIISKPARQLLAVTWRPSRVPRGRNQARAR